LKASLLDVLLCPHCAESGLTLSDARIQTVTYGERSLEEVRAGRVVCPTCRGQFPVEDYVLSLVDLLPKDVRADGEYWGEFYRWHYDQGHLGYFDLRRPLAPFLSYGVAEAMPMDGTERLGVHNVLADHPLIRHSRRVLDVGCGTGWSSLYMARGGFDVVAIDPSLDSVKMAKAYALGEGTFVEYVAAAPGTIRFKPEAFDTVFAFHSLHHVPDVGACLADIRTWLSPGGCLAIDEHIQNSVHGAEFHTALMEWARQDVLPAYMSAEWPATSLPERASPNEDQGQASILLAIERTLHVEYIAFRYVFLDVLGDLYYFKSGRSIEATRIARDVTNTLYQILSERFPQEIEYVTLIAQKQISWPHVPQEKLAHVRRKHAHLFNPRSKMAPPVSGTPWYLLPYKAAYIFWNKGPAALLREVNTYLRWRAMLRKVSDRSLIKGVIKK
jgi:SAM-dependent methyltransferase